jgi:hypothetical protein
MKDTFLAGFGSKIWVIAACTSIFLLIISWIMILSNKKLSHTAKMIWIIETGIAPIIGPLLYFVSLLIDKKDVKRKQK